MPFLLRCLSLRPPPFLRPLRWRLPKHDTPNAAEPRKVDFDTWRPAEENEEEGK